MLKKIQVPGGWQAVRLGDVAEVVTGNTPPRETSDYYGGNIPWVKPSDLASSRLVDSSEEYLTKGGAVVAKQIPENCVLVSCIGTIGEVAISRVPLCFNQQINALIPSDTVWPPFLYWACNGQATRLLSMSAKTAVPILNKSAFSAVPILLPPLPEQRAIAAVLDAIDDTIERTEAVIAATEELRRSLLHELLTRGAPGQHSEWRDVPGVGTVPACWEVVRLGDVVTLQRGVDLPIQDRVQGSVPVYGSNGILGTHAQALHPGPGVITGRSGSIGVVYSSTGPYWPLNTTLYVRDFHGNSDRFIYYLLSQLKLERFAASTGVPSLNRNFVHPQPVACPPLAEQRLIVAVLDGVDEAIERAREEKAGLQSLKASASGALLTGSVRVRQFNG